MGVVQVDRLCTQQLQALFALDLEQASGQAAGHRTILKAHLGCQEQPGAVLAPLHPAPQQRFGLLAHEACYPMGVDIGGVNKATASVYVLASRRKESASLLRVPKYMRPGTAH